MTSDRTAGFIPEKFFSQKRKELKTLLARSERNVKYIAGGLHDIKRFYEKFESDLVEHGMNQYAQESVKERVETVQHALGKIIQSYDQLEGVLRLSPHPITTPMEAVTWYIMYVIENAANAKVPNLASALKVTLATNYKLIQILAKRTLAKATPQELSAIEYEVANPDSFSHPLLKVRWDFYQRIGLDASAKRLLQREKVGFDFIKWFERLYSVLGTNYTQSALEGFREFSLGDMKVVIVDPTISIWQNNAYIQRMIEARSALKRKGFDKLWYGVFFIVSKESNKLNDQDKSAYRALGYETLESQAGTYHTHGDYVRLYAPPDNRIIRYVVHELGHRYWYKMMAPEQRARFNGLVQTNVTEISRDFPSGQLEKGVKKPVTPVSDYGQSSIEEAFAMAFEHYVLDQDMSRDQFESFRSVLASGPSLAERVLERFLKQNPSLFLHA